MNLSSILVITPSEHLESTIDALNKLKGVEVHVSEEQSGRIIATQEAESISAEVEGLKRIKALPGIMFAEMVFHYFEDESNALPVELPAELDNSQGGCRTESACY